MTRQQKRKMERNSKKKQTSMLNIFSIAMVDTKSIIEQKSQFILTEEDLENAIKMLKDNKLEIIKNKDEQANS